MRSTSSKASIKTPMPANATANTGGTAKPLKALPARTSTFGISLQEGAWGPTLRIPTNQAHAFYANQGAHNNVSAELVLHAYQTVASDGGAQLLPR